jgi:hypothetical protein
MQGFVQFARTILLSDDDDGPTSDRWALHLVHAFAQGRVIVADCDKPSAADQARMGKARGQVRAVRPPRIGDPPLVGFNAAVMRDRSCHTVDG